jgi:hypothetical protein
MCHMFSSYKQPHAYTCSLQYTETKLYVFSVVQVNFFNTSFYKSQLKDIESSIVEP